MNRPAAPDRDTRRDICDLLSRGPLSTFHVVCRVPMRGAQRVLTDLENEGVVRLETRPGGNVWALTEKGYGASAP